MSTTIEQILMIEMNLDWKKNRKMKQCRLKNIKKKKKI